MTTKSPRLSLPIALLLIALLLGAFWSPRPWTAAAQGDAPTANTLPRTITVVGEGSVTVEPDVARTNIGVEVTGDNVKAASDEAAGIMQAILQSLADLGVAQKDVQTAGYSIYMDRTPIGPQGEMSQEIVYRVNNSVAVTIRDLDAVGDVLNAAIEAGANNIYGVDFSVDDPDQAMAEARREASEDARARAEELAALHGVAVGDVVSISEVIGGGFASGRAYSLASEGIGGGGGISPGELKLSARLQVVYAMASAAEARAPASTSTGQPGAAEAPPSVATVAVATVAPMAATPTPLVPASTPVAESGEGEAPASLITTLLATVVPPAAPTEAASGPPATPTPVGQTETIVTQQTVERSMVVTVQPSSGEPGELTIVGGDEQTLRRFLERWLVARYPGAPEGQEARLLLGQLPAAEDLPFAVPLPEGAAVVASLVQGDPMGTQIILDAEQPADEVLDFYVQQLTARGFITPTRSLSSGDVFSSSDTGQMLCNDEDELIVYITAYDVADDPTDVRLNVNPMRGYTPCNPPPERQMDGMGLLPRLEPPADVTRTQGGAGSQGNDSAYASADLETGLSVAELAQHYMAQLEAVGWELVDESEIEAVAWSVWTFDDEDGDAWNGSLLVTDRPAVSDGRFAMLRVERAKQATP